MRTLCGLTYTSTILVCVMSYSNHVVLGSVLIGHLKLYLIGEGRKSPIVFQNTHIHYL